MKQENMKVFLRMFEEDDYLLINQWRNDYDQVKFMHSQFRYVSSAIEREWVRSKMMENTKEIYLAICLNDGSRRMIGYASIIGVDYINRSARVGGIWIGDKSQRNSLHNAQALYLLLCYAFRTYNLESIRAHVITEHSSSKILSISLGSQQEGIIRHSVLKNGQFHDEYIMGLLREEFLTIEKKGGYSDEAIMERMKQALRLQQEGLSATEIWHRLYDNLLSQES